MPKKPKEPRLPKSLQLYDQTATEEAWARILVLGAAKTGKTTSILTTAPGPIFVLNCDDAEKNASALNFAKQQGAEFSAVNVRTIRQWHDAVSYAVELSKAEKIQTCVLDTITLLAQSLLNELKQEEWEDRRQMWGEFGDELQMGFRELCRVDCHLFIVAHPLPHDDGLLGILPAIPGKSAAYIPAEIADWIWFDYDPKLKPVRAFLVGPQKSWSHGARNAKRSVRISANATELIEELGMTP